MRWQEKEKRHLGKKNCQEGLWQRNYLGGQTNSTTKNIGKDWSKIGDNEKINKQKEKKNIKDNSKRKRNWVEGIGN